MMDSILSDIKTKMQRSLEALAYEFNKIRTGRANPDLFNNIMVDYYGTPTPLIQVSTISVPESRLITMQPYEKTLIPVIEKAIIDANLGYTPSNNGNAIHIPIPSLSEERRLDLTKFVHKIIEEGRIAVRNIRRDALHKVNDYAKSESVSEDEIKGRETDLQALTDKKIKELNEHQDRKEKELMEV